MCNEQFEGWAFDRVCQFVGSAGYDGLEVAPFTLAAADHRRLSGPPRRAADSRPPTPASRSSACTGCWPRPRVSTSRRPTRRSAAAPPTTSWRWPRPAATSAARLMVFGSPQQRSLLPGVTIGTGATSWPPRHSVQRTLPALADLGVTLCMEPLSPPRPTSSTRATRRSGWRRWLDHPNFVLHLDVKAMCSEPTPPTELIRRHGAQAGHFHANDANRRGPGFRRRRLRADLPGAAGFRLRPLGLGRGVRLHAGSRNDRPEEHRVHAMSRAVAKTAPVRPGN